MMYPYTLYKRGPEIKFLSYPEIQPKQNIKLNIFLEKKNVTRMEKLEMDGRTDGLALTD